MLKRLIRKSTYSLTQGHHRLTEKDEAGANFLPRRQQLHIPSRLQHGDYYKSLKFTDFELRLGLRNGTFNLNNGEIAVAEKTKKSSGIIVVECRKFLECESAYNYPCDSSLISVRKIKVDKVSDPIDISASLINKKCVLRKSSSEAFVYPLLHCN